MTDARAIFQATLDFLVAHMRPDEDVHSVVLRTLGSDDVVAITGDVQWYLLHKDVDSAQSLHDLLDERTLRRSFPKSLWDCSAGAPASSTGARPSRAACAKFCDATWTTST